MAHAESLSRSPPPIPLSIAQITVIIKHLAKKMLLYTIICEFVSKFAIAII